MAARRRFDVAGAVTVTVGLALLVYAVATAAGHGWARSATPQLPLSFLRNRAVLALAGLLLGLRQRRYSSATGVKATEAGLASGLINASQQIGGAIGVAVTATVAASRATAPLHVGRPPTATLTGGYHDAFALIGALGLAAAIAAATAP